MKVYLLISAFISIVAMTPLVPTLSALPILFFTWYMGIALEHVTRLEKTAPALMAGFLMWAKLSITGDAPEHSANHVLEHVAQILIFIMCAMTIVEMVLLHQGFNTIKKRVAASGSMKKLYWSVIVLSGIFTMIIDNLTTTIFMGGFVLSMITIAENKKWFISAIVIIANIMGVCSVLGDLTTTMEWLRGLITVVDTTLFLFPACFISASIAAFWIYKKIQHEDLTSVEVDGDGDPIILYTAIASFFLIPILKGLLHMEPWQIIPFSLGLVWIVCELRHPEQNYFNAGKQGKNIMHAWSKIEISAVFFFFGILFAVSSMTTVGQIERLCVGSLGLAQNYSPMFGFDIISYMVGVFSAIIDNVPMMQAAMDGFEFAKESYEWYSLAYTAGSGGNLLVIGSAAGVIAMTMVEGLSFGWWIKRVTIISLTVYTVGFIVVVAMRYFYF